MAALNFPSSPTNGQKYTENGITYTYNSTYQTWEATNFANAPIGYTGSSGTTAGKAIAMAILFSN